MPQVTPALDLKRLRCGSSGDTIIELRKGLAGVKYSHVRNVTSLKLRRIGDQAIGYSSDRAFMGKYKKSSHLLAAIPIPRTVVQWSRSGGAEAHASQVLDSERTVEPWGDVMSRHLTYPNTSVDVVGNYFELTGGEYIQVEVDPTAATVLWSTSLDIRDAIKVVEDILSSPSEQLDGYLVTEDGIIESNSADVTSTALERPERVLAYAATYGDTTISWRRKQRKMRDASAEFAEIGLSAKRISVRLLRRLISGTATEAVHTTVTKEMQPLRDSLGSVAEGD